jgi:hypothetical protein
LPAASLSLPPHVQLCRRISIFAPHVHLYRRVFIFDALPVWDFHGPAIF